MDIWVVGTSNHIFYKGFLNWNKIFKKNKAAIGKTPFFVIGRFSTHHSIFVALTLASDMAVLYENDALSILALSTKRRYSSFRFPENLFQS